MGLIPNGGHHARWEASYEAEDKDENGAASAPWQWRASHVRERLAFHKVEEEWEQTLAWQDL